MRCSIVPLGDLLTPAPIRRAGDANYPILSMTMRHGLVLQSEKFNKRIASRDTANYRVIKKGELVVGFPIDEAVLSIQRVADAGIVSPAYEVWRVNASRVDDKFLERYLRSSTAIAYYKANMRGTTARRKSLPDDKFKGMPVPLPNINEQRRIASILDKADAIHRKREESLALADDLLKSAFLEMFGDPAVNPNGFKPRKLGSMLSMPLRNGISPSSMGQIEAEVLTLSAITGSFFDVSQKKVGRFVDAIAEKDQVSAMDFYICRGNGSPDLVGRGFFASTDMNGVAFPDTMIAARPKTDELNRDFLQAVWSSSHVRAQIITAARTTNGTYKINQTATENIEFPLPPAPMQEAFSRRAAVIREVQGKAAQDLAAAVQLFRGLSQRAFRGEL